MTAPRITYDRNGVPGVWADDCAGAYRGIGVVHGRHRPLQALLLGAAAHGELAAHLLPLGALVSIDVEAHRWDLRARGERAAAQLDGETRQWLQAYLDGFKHGLHEGSRGWLLRRLPPLTPERVLSGLLLSAYMGLAQCQERMENALVASLQHGGSARLLEQLFAPHLHGWAPDVLQAQPIFWRGRVGAWPQALGSNAWAVAGERTVSGRPMLCGDPHLQINQLPALLCELRVRVGDDYWLGATIPGLPGIATGRNRTLAWSGTFSVADNIDGTLTDDGVARDAHVGRRFLRPLRLRFYDSPLGVRLDGSPLAVRWAAAEKAHEALAAYMRLPLARDVDAAEVVLRRAHTMSLHFVLADKRHVRYVQAGRIPKRVHSGLFPATRDAWIGIYEGSELPRAAGDVIVSANEARLAPDGGVLATLAQPDYRLGRIEALLCATQRHTARSMAAIQHDVVSLQAQRLVPVFLPLLRDAVLLRALRGWDGQYDVESVGATAFECVYRAAWRALAPFLGGDWFFAMLGDSELAHWWAAAFDRLVAAPEKWPANVALAIRGALGDLVGNPVPWGDDHQVSFQHLIFGGAWGARPAQPLKGNLATVSQGAVLRVDGQQIVIGPAYRFITDLADDSALTSLPGGVDDSPSAGSYAAFLSEWSEGGYHRIEPLGSDER